MYCEAYSSVVYDCYADISITSVGRTVSAHSVGL